MFIPIVSNNSRLPGKRRLFVFGFILLFLCILPLCVLAHPSPNSLVFLDISPDRVAMEIQLPLPELELAFGHDVSKDPGTLIEKLGPQIRAYLISHVHAYVNKGYPWQLDITGLSMDNGTYMDSNIPYWEVVAHLVLKPQHGETTRKFMLDYDVIMHQVMNHVAFVSIRSDWETGNLQSSSPEALVIRRNIEDDKIYPLEVSLEKGTWLRRFKSMLTLGMVHIQEGTDHLSFLLVLLLPAMLLTNGNKWGGFGGIKYSMGRLLKIITAFTLGHSTTLLIGALGWLKLPQQPVEIMIAFSILVSAVHAIYPVFPGKEMYVAAGFGLIHGLAFATILSNLSLGAGTLAMSILGFNLGIEIMQLIIVLLIIPWLILLSKTPAYKWLRIPGAVLAGIAALAWIGERVSGNPNLITAFILKASQYSIWGIVFLMGISILTFAWYNYKSHAQNIHANT